MNGATAAETRLGLCVILGLAAIGCFRLIRYFMLAPRPPDPWGLEISRDLESPDAREVCLHCLAEQSPGAWFCPECGSGTGPYNTIMPYLNVFSQAEALRHGTAQPRRFNNRQILGYLVLSLAMLGPLAPIYWFVLAKNVRRSRQLTDNTPDTPPLAN